MKAAMEKLDIVVVIDPFPTVTAVLPDRQEGMYLLPATTQFESSGSVTASNRSMQWRERVIEPLFDSKTDHAILNLFATKLGFADELLKHIEVVGDEPVIEDITREFNRGMWTVGYTGQSPERIKAHMEHRHTFDTVSLQAKGGPLDGEYYGLPWPCWGTPEMKHPGSPNLYDTSKPVAEGGLPFRARFGVERDGVNLLAEDSWSAGSEIEDGYPEFTAEMLAQLGWDGDLTEEERAASEGKNWKTDLSGGIQRVAIAHGCAPYGNAKARTVVWTFPDPVPVHREPLYTSRRDLVEDYPTYEDRKSHYRLPTRYGSIQAEDFSEGLPAHPHLRATGGVRGRRRGDALEPVARRAAAGHVRRDQPERRERSRRAGRAGHLARGSGRRAHPDQGDGHRARRARRRVHAVPLRRRVPGRGPARQVPRRGGADGARRVRQRADDLRLRLGHPDAGSPSARCAASSSPDATPHRKDQENTMARMKFLCDAERCIECNGCVTACKNEHEVPWGVNRRRVVTLDDGGPGEKSISVACMHCSDAPCQAVCPVDCFYTTNDGIVLHSKDLCIGCGYCFYACPFGAPQYPQQSSFGARGKMDKCTFCAGGPEEDLSTAEYEKYGRNRIAEGKLPLCAEMCATKALIAGDGDQVADIYRERVLRRGGRPQTWGWETAYDAG